MSDQSQQAILYYIWLGLRLYAGSPTAKILLEHYGDIVPIYHGTPKDYAALDISPKDAKKLADKDLTLARRCYDYCMSEHIGFLCYDNPYYPDRLRAIDNPPPLLYYRGRVQLLDDYPLFAMVGTRSCSESGFRTAYRIAYKTARAGGVIVNGLALGVDTACMRAALDADGYAVGLLGCGIDRIYPASNKELFQRLSRQGLILTEFPPFTRPEAHNFPVRNRVISALSVASVIFEASEGSGALITASHALSQGRKLFAVPGDVNDSLYAGPLALIKDGAKVVTDAGDILTEYSLMFPHRINTSLDTAVPMEFENAAVVDAFTPEALEKERTSSHKRTLPKPKRGIKESADNGTVKNGVRERIPRKKMTVAEQSSDFSVNEPSKEAAEFSADTSVLSPQEQTLYAFFEKNPVLTVDEIAAKGIKIDDVLSSLTLLEVYGFIRLLPGGRYEKI